MSSNNIRDSSMRGMHFNAILYPDSTSYDCYAVLDMLPDVFEKYAIALHDCDTDENGELKKPHFHVYGKRSGQSTCKATAKKLGIEENALEYVRSWKRFVRYLIHADNPEKYQYEPTVVESNFDVTSILDPATEAKRVRELVGQIMDGNTTTFGLVTYALENNCWSELRRSYSIMKDLIAERNRIYG